MRVLISEKLSEHKYKTPEGYLICTDAILARTGKQTYTRDELFGDGDNTEVNVDRPYNEVMNEKTIASFENKPVTFDHPEEDVNIGNYKSYAVGYVRDVHQGRVDGKDVILGNLVITDKDAINAIENGDHTDLSCGYDCDIRDDGNGNYAQNNIRGNHVALCKEGRAGMARIVDSKVKDSNYIYEFYYNDIDNEDRRMMRKYNLEVVGKSGKDRGQRNLAVKGSLENLKRYAKDWLGYELHPNYLIPESQFAYDMYDSVKDSKVRDYFILREDMYGDYLISKSPIKWGRKKDAYKFNNLNELNDFKWKIEKIDKDFKAVRSTTFEVKDTIEDSGYTYKGYDLIDFGNVIVVQKDGRTLVKCPTEEEAEKWVDEHISAFGDSINGDNLLGKRVRIRKRYSNLDGTIGTIFSYEGTNYDDEVEVERNGHIYKVDYEDIEFLDSKMKDDDESWFEMLLKRALKEHEKEFSSNIGPMVANKVAKKCGVKISYIKNSKEYYYKYTYVINDSKMKDASYKLTRKRDDKVEFAKIAKSYNLKTYSNDTIEGRPDNIEEFIHDYCKERFDKNKLRDAMRDSKSMTMSGVIKMLNVVNAYKKVKDAAIDEWVIKNSGLAYEVWNNDKMVKKFPTKKLAVEWIRGRFPTDKITEA